MADVVIFETTDGRIVANAMASMPVISCWICFEPSTLYSALDCGHAFCNTCCTAFLGCRLAEGSFFALCPELACLQCISPPLVASLIAPSDALRVPLPARGRVTLQGEGVFGRMVGGWARERGRVDRAYAKRRAGGGGGEVSGRGPQRRAAARRTSGGAAACRHVWRARGSGACGAGVGAWAGRWAGRVVCVFISAGTNRSPTEYTRGSMTALRLLLCGQRAQ